MADELVNSLEQRSVEGWGGGWVLPMVDRRVGWMDCWKAERWDIVMAAVWDWVQDKNLDYC